MTSTNTNWRFDDQSEDLRIFRTNSFPDCHVTMFSSGDYHASFNETQKSMHYGYCRSKFKISGGTKLKRLFFKFENDLLKGLIPLSKNLCDNLLIKREREQSDTTPLEAYLVNNETKKKAQKRRISSPKNQRHKKRKLSE